jgi:hypothetical protein
VTPNFPLSCPTHAPWGARWLADAGALAALLSACEPADLYETETLYWATLWALPVAAVAWLVAAWRTARRARLESEAEREAERGNR